MEAGRQRRAGAVNSARRGNSKGRFYAILGLIAVGGAGAIGYAATHQSQSAQTGAPRAVDPALAAEAKGHTLGNPSAPVKILEFSDFECPYCAQFATVTEPDVRKRLVETGEASFVYYDYPLPMHPNTWPASHAGMCAEEQGKFWEMKDRLFNGQTEWNGQATSNPKKVFVGYAQALGLDVPKFEQCYDSQKYLRAIQANVAEGDRRQLDGTPTFFVNDRKYAGTAYDQIKALVDSAKATAAPVAVAPAAAPAPAAATPATTPK